MCSDGTGVRGEDTLWMNCVRNTGTETIFSLSEWSIKWINFAIVSRVSLRVGKDMKTKFMIPRMILLLLLLFWRGRRHEDKFFLPFCFSARTELKGSGHLRISFCHPAKLFTPHLLLLICESIYLSPSTSPAPPTICRIAFPCVWHYRLDWGHRRYLEIRVRWGLG